MNRLKHIQVLDRYLIQLEFSDGFRAIVDLKPFLGRGITADLLDYKNFRRVHIEPGGGLEWYNGFDFCPNALREMQPQEP